MKIDLRSTHGARLVAVLSAAGAVAYVVWGFLPQREALAELRQEIEAKQAAVAQGTRIVQEIANTTEELFVARRYVQRWSDAAPSQESLILLFRDVNHLSQIAGTRNLRLEPAPVEPLAAVWRAPVSLSVEGNFLQLFDFVRGLETLSPAMDLASIEMDQVSGAPDSLRMRAALTVFGVKPDFPVTQNLPTSR
jgi:Tfp pilus assembly protein PilO